MSYILDALKRADAERERGAIPGLHSQPQAPIPDDEEDHRKAKMPPVVWLSAGAALCLIGVLSWQLLMRPGATPEQAVVAQPTPSGQSEPAPQNTSSQGQAAAVHQPVTPPTFVEAEEPRAAAASPAARTRTARDEAQASPPHKDAAGNNGRPTAIGNTAPAQASQRVPTFNELPDDVRREIPALTIGGAMYSETPASRMLIINSQVFHEGDQPYQGLLLEEIRLKSAIFKYRGYRYSINY